MYASRVRHIILAHAADLDALLDLAEDNVTDLALAAAVQRWREDGANLRRLAKALGPDALDAHDDERRERDRLESRLYATAVVR